MQRVVLRESESERVFERSTKGGDDIAAMVVHPRKTGLLATCSDDGDVFGDALLSDKLPGPPRACTDGTPTAFGAVRARVSAAPVLPIAMGHRTGRSLRASLPLR